MLPEIATPVLTFSGMETQPVLSSCKGHRKRYKAFLRQEVALRWLLHSWTECWKERVETAWAGLPTREVLSLPSAGSIKKAESAVPVS